ncbi:MAG: class I SAM-dependent methyltransferase [Acidobacteriota bacterium]
MFLLAAALVFGSLSPPAREILSRAGIDERSFPGFVRSIQAEAARREREGEQEHLVYFMLQSASFTKLPKIEPALSAREWKAGGGLVPEVVRRRVAAFLASPVRGERMRYLRSILPRENAHGFVLGEYSRTMAVLYGKEFGQAADFYQTRGHSTDTSVAANYAVWSALRVLKAMHPALRLERVLVIGPGLDFAPRTGLDERYEPQSYQPFAIADALYGLELAKLPKIDCLDINARVVRFFEDFRGRPRAELRLTTMPGDEDYMRYFRSLGKSSGTIKGDGKGDGLEKTLTLRPDIVRSITAARGNIVTDPPPAKYDLVIATNILVYCKDPELLLAMSNIAASLKSGGYFLTNEIRPVMDIYSEATGLTPEQARTLLVARGANAPLYDSFAIYSKMPDNVDTFLRLK